MTKFNSTSVGVKRKTYSHNLSFDNNTTMDFGFMQPLLSQLLEPKSQVRLSAKQLVRLAPMPTPSFARMFVQNYAQFVKMTDVVPYYEALLARLSYRGSSGTSYKPTQMPCISNNILFSFLLSYSWINVYVKQPSGQFQPVVGSTVDAAAALKNYLYGTNWYGELPTLAPQEGNPVTPFNADYTIQVGDRLFCVRYSLKAIRLRKQFIGLGFSLNCKDVHPLSLAPLLAYFKAYFDRFGLTREYNFLDTSCFQLIKLIEDYHYDFITCFQNNSTQSQTMRNALKSFIDDLSKVYYSSADDILSVHRASPTNFVENGTIPFELVGTDKELNLDSQGGNNPNLYPVLQSLYSDGFLEIDNVSLETLKRLSSYVSKDSAIGKRLSDWVRVHYGVQVSNSLFADSFNVASWRTNISIDDVFSTSDTADIAAANKGEYLGAYAGKGIGFGTGNFEFTAPSAGFLFVLSCVVPQSGIFIGNDPSLYALDWNTIPHPEFDALGYELTPLSCFISDNGLSSDADHTSYTNGSFGYVPRYTGFKFKKNVVNGYMYQGFFNRDLQPYFNDRIINNNYMKFTGDASSFSLEVSTHNAPTASTSWQQLCARGFLSDFNRLFYNNPDSSNTTDEDADAVLSDNFDNFIVQSVFDFRVTNWMLPLSMSYDTLSDDDSSTVDVQNN